MHIVDVVYYWARAVPRRIAVIEPTGSISYADLAYATEAAAAHFAETIEDKSKPVGVSVEIWIETASYHFGVASIGIQCRFSKQASFQTSRLCRSCSAHL